MQDDQIPSWEKMPGETINTVSQENLDRADAFESAMDDAPEFAGDTGEKYDNEISQAAALIGYGVNAAASELGVEYVVDAINNFDAAGSDDIIEGLYKNLGVDTPKEARNLRDEAEGTKSHVEGYLADSPNGKPIKKPSKEGASQAIKDMKELVMVVKSDPKYEELRAGASSMGIGIFDYAVREYGKQDFVTLMKVLAEQRVKTPEEAEDELKDNIYMNLNINQVELIEDDSALSQTADETIDHGIAEGQTEEEMLENINKLFEQAESETITDEKKDA